MLRTRTTPPPAPSGANLFYKEQLLPYLILLLTDDETLHPDGRGPKSVVPKLFSCEGHTTFCSSDGGPGPFVTEKV